MYIYELFLKVYTIAGTPVASKIQIWGNVLELLVRNINWSSHYGEQYGDASKIKLQYD